MIAVRIGEKGEKGKRERSDCFTDKGHLYRARSALGIWDYLDCRIRRYIRMLYY